MSAEHTELVPHEPQPLALSNQNPIAPMIEAITKTGVTGENMAVLERMMALYERQEARNAEKAFAEAFVALQSDLPAIQQTKAVPDKFGNIKYHFAPYEEIMHTVRPILQKHGFTVTFSMSFGEGRVTQECILQHVAGHIRTNKFMARIGNGPPGSSEAQGDGAASTYAKRFALCNALNIVTEIDTDGKDARAVGEFISSDKISYLKEQVKETGSDVTKFLAMAGARSFEEITTGSYDVLVRALAAKGRK